MRRLAIGLLVVLVAAAPAGADIVDKKQSVDERIASLQGRVQAAKEKEAALQSEIDAVSDEDPRARAARSATSRSAWRRSSTSSSCAS